MSQQINNIFLFFVFVFLQCGRGGQALRHQQNSHRLRFCRTLQPVWLAEGTGLALPAHVSCSAQRLFECHVSIPSLRTPTAMRTREHTLCQDIVTHDWSLDGGGQEKRPQLLQWCLHFGFRTGGWFSPLNPKSRHFNQDLEKSYRFPHGLAETAELWSLSLSKWRTMEAFIKMVLVHFKALPTARMWNAYDDDLWSASFIFKCSSESCVCACVRTGDQNSQYLKAIRHFEHTNDDMNRP